MEMKIGNFEIRRYDKRNLEVIEHVEKEIKSQMIADNMGKFREINFGDGFKPGDKYQAEEHWGYFPDLHKAATRVLDLAIERNDLSSCGSVEMIRHWIDEAKQEILEAIKNG